MDEKMKPNNAISEQVIREEKLHILEKKGILPFPSKAKRSHTIAEALKSEEKTPVTVVGRILTKREMGKLTFCHIQDDTGKIQLVFNKATLDEDSFTTFAKLVDSADIISAHGERFATHKGEPSVLVTSWTLLTKTLRPLPDKFHGLQDEELRLRKRYLDLFLHPELRDLFRRKAMFWQSMRLFLLQEGFLEVETPVLETTTGGADAKPFVTHHDALDVPVYLRISNGELWQKRLMVGGFEKTFEIGRQFRNEGMSREHLQDYSQMEFYWAYANYEDGMSLVERMYKYVIEKTYGRLLCTIGAFGEIDFSKPWGRISYAETIEVKTGVNILTASEKEIRNAIKKLEIHVDTKDGRGRLIDSLWKFCRKTIAGPVFLVDLPVSVSPLAKRKADNPDLTERYQIIVAGSELGNGYSELNDPIDQAKRFEEQRELREAGDSEAQMYDYDFVEALEHGMPPTTGFGVSERLFSFLENRPIRECVLFPLLKPSTPD